MAHEPVTVVEVDIDLCTRSFGVAPCTATLGGAVVRKCYGTFKTCAAKPAFASAPFTLRFSEPRGNMPAGGLIFPAVSAVSVMSSTVNIAGSDDKASALGRRATVKVTFQDFPFHDRGIDPYQAERVSGAAQVDEPGYDPGARGTFFTKLRARWPHYSGRALRVLECDVAGGVLIVEKTRHFVISDWTGPDASGLVTVEAKDILDLADNDRALAPATSNGVLSADIDAAASSLTLSPAGIGDAEYPAAGRAKIGSELVDYTRSGNVVTLTARGVRGTKATDHSSGDAFQVVLSFQNARLDDVLEVLLRDYAKVPSAFIPKADWAAEVSRWMPSTRLTADIATPTGVAKLVGSLAVLGPSIWWDDVLQRIGLRANRPAVEGVRELDEQSGLKDIELEDRNEDRLTQVLFYSVQLDPTKSDTSADNYARLMATVDLEAEGPSAHADTRVRRIFCRWFNDGADLIIHGLSRRLLNRFREAPMRARMVLDAKDGDIGLTDVLSVTSRVLTDETGKPVPRLFQVISREETVPGMEFEIVAQAYDFAGRYGVATEAGRPSYSASTNRQRASGFYAVDPLTLRFPDGTGPYVAS